MATLLLTVGAFSKPVSSVVLDQQSKQSRRITPDSLRRYLARGEDDEEAIQELFVAGDSAVPSLVKALRGTNKQARIRAAKGIAYIGTRPGIDALRGAVERERDKETKAVLSFFLAGRLPDAQSKADFDFLVSSVNRALAVKDPDDDEAFPAVTAVLALGLTGKSDCLPVLRKATELDFADSEEIVKAVHWVEKESLPGHGKQSVPTDGLASNEEERRCAAARNFDDTHAKAIASSASKRGTTLLSLESVL